MTTTNETFTAFWIGRCPVKGCKCVIHFDVPMIRERWTETQHDHARGQKWEVPRSRSFPSVFHRGFTPSGLDLHCAAHRRQLRWTPVNGSFSEAHVCDSRCMNATGPNCECSCGGANHGRGHHVELIFTAKTDLRVGAECLV